jgi:uncharacterized membrane-anchored protein
MSYVVTRPLGASFADYISKPREISGVNFGDGPTAIVFAVAVFVFVVYLAIVRPDIQRQRGAAVGTWSTASAPHLLQTGAPEFDMG